MILIILLFLLLPGYSQAQFYFGRNKIQYDRFDWQMIESDHFNVYYYTEELEIARAALQLAETAFRDMELKFNHTIDKHIPLVIYSNHIHFQQTNILPSLIPEGVGGFFEFMKRRVAVPYSGNMADFRHVVRHEIVHVFMTHKFYTESKKAGLRDIPYIPLWFTEGLAEYWSQGWDTQAELIIRDAVLHDYLLPLDSFALMMSGFLLYKEGQSFLRYFVETYGEDKLRLLMETCWQYKTFQDAIKTITQTEKYHFLISDWMLCLKKKYAVSLSRENTLSTNQFRLTKYGMNGEPVFLPDSSGGKMIFLSNRNGYTDIYSRPIGSRKNTLLVKGERTASRESMHLMQGRISVNRNGLLAYVAKSGSGDALYIMDVRDKKTIASLQHPNMVTIRSPKWSPDDKTLVFTAHDFGGQSDLYLWDYSSDNVLKLTDDIYSDSDPCFSPDGNRIIFSSDRGNPQIEEGLDLFLLTLSDLGMERLTNDSHKNTNPFWPPDQPGSIYYLSDRSGMQNVWKIHVPTEKMETGQKLQSVQKTNYHTGIQDIFPISENELLVSALKSYNYQIHKIPLVHDSTMQTVTHRTEWISDSAWQIPATDHAIKNKSQPYQLKYSLDFAQTGMAYDPIFGYLGGAQIGVSDMLGNRYYHFMVFNTAQARSEILDRFNVTATMMDLSKRVNRSIGIFRFANEHYNSYEGYYYEQSLGVRTALYYPINYFNRLELSATFWHSFRDFHIEKPTKALLMSNFVSYVHDNTLWCPTGPLTGWRMRLTAGPTFDFKRSQIHNVTALLDFRYYWRLHRGLTLAHRSLIWFNRGEFVRRYYIGGSWGLRGYDLREIYGKNVFMVNHELRFPLAHSLTLDFGRTGIGLAPIRGALFFDVGNAWDDTYPGLIGSFGIGLRSLFLGGIVLRLDFGRKTDFHIIDNKWFTQFFFGWDF